MQHQAQMFSSGMHIGKYLLGKKLGQGGFGVVFRAHDESLDREVALKFLTAEASGTPQILQRFLQEARSAAKVAHPGIVTVYECGQLAEANNAAYIAMELLDGESLTDRLARSGRLAAGEAMEIARQVASALEAAHRAGIVHRDLKPDNIFLVKDPAVVNGERVKVLDFGIAKLGRNASAQTQPSGVNTLSMMVFGTPRYMSPEQCKSAAHVDHRSDIYTLGCILFELVTGRPPFGGSAGELIACHVLVDAPSILSIVPEAPPELATLVAAMLAKEPEQRPQTMAAVQRQLESGGAIAPGVAPTLLPNAMPLLQAPRASGSFGIPPQPQPTPQAIAQPISQPISGRVSAPLAVPATPTTLGGAASSSVSRKTGAPPQSRKRIAFYIAGAGIAAAIGLTIGLSMRGDGSTHAAPPEVAEPTIREPAPRVAAAPPNAATVKPEPVTPPTPPPTPPATNKDDAKPKLDPKKTAQPPKKVNKRVHAAPDDKPDPVAASGAITISATPACEVKIAGVAGSLHTPIRGYKLPAGTHRITLVNAELGVNDTFSVEIKDGATETVSRDYTKKTKDKTINPFQKSSP